MSSLGVDEQISSFGENTQDRKLKQELLREGLYKREGVVDQTQQDASGTGAAQTNPVLLTVIIIAALEMGSVWMLAYFDFCQLKSDAIRWSPCSVYLTLWDAEEAGPGPTKHLSDSISLDGTTCILKIKHALKCFAGLVPVCAMGGKIRFILITRVLLWFSHAGGLCGFIYCLFSPALQVVILIKISGDTK